MTREPTDERNSRGTGMALRIAIFVVLLLLGVYALAYFIEPVRTDIIRGTAYRFYRREWIVRLFIPAAWVEAKVFRRTTVLCHLDENDPEQGYWEIEP